MPWKLVLPIFRSCSNRTHWLSNCLKDLLQPFFDVSAVLFQVTFLEQLSPQTGFSILLDVPLSVCFKSCPSLNKTRPQDSGLFFFCFILYLNLNSLLCLNTGEFLNKFLAQVCSLSYPHLHLPLDISTVSQAEQVTISFKSLVLIFKHTNIFERIDFTL